MTQKKSNILWLIKGLGLGGAEKLLTSATPYLDMTTFNYQVGYFLPWKDTLVPELEETGLGVHCFNVKSVADISAISKLVRYIRAHNIDLIHAHLPHTGIIARLTGRITNVPVVYTEHNVWGRLHPAMRWLNRVTFGLNTQAIAVSRDVAGSMRGVESGAVRVIDNGIDCSGLARIQDENEGVRREFNVPGDHFLIGNVANLSAKKNHENLLQAVAIFFKSQPQASLLLVGQSFDRMPALKRLVVDLGISEHVHFTGGREDVPRIVRALDLFVMSSDYEGLPIAMLEAMALKKPIVSTAVGGIPGVVRDGVDGFLVPAKNAQALAEKMLLVASNPGLRLAMGDNACQRAKENYDISSMVKKVETVYREVLENSQ